MSPHKATEYFSVAQVSDVAITSSFWSRMQQCSREKTVPAIIKAQKTTDHWSCLKWKANHPVKPHQFWDSDIYKITEAQCYFLMTHHDEKMLANVEEAVDMIRAAQHPDGYINTYYTVTGIHKRFTNLRDMHELYCMGHLIEACVAYETLRGTGRLLEPVMKMIRLVHSTFGREPGKIRGYPGHQEIEIGLTRLYELTQDKICLDLASYFIHERGQKDENDEVHFDREVKARGGDPYEELGDDMKVWYRFPRDYSYHQADVPITEANEVVGHSVRAMYYYMAATDLVRLDNDRSLKPALDRLWKDLTTRKMYLTGGIGGVRQWEGFGPGYALNDLEHEGCYTETCASFALVNWAQRLLQLELKSEYSDIMELALYNGFLGAVGQDGGSFYYQNPLRTFTGKPKNRDTWFEVACCPPNVAKLLGQLGSFIFSHTPTEVAVHLYIESEFTVPNSDAVVSITTEMPWSGDVEINVKGKVNLALRIPSWTKTYECSVEGHLINGYLHVASQADTIIKLRFPMKPRKVYAHPKTNKDEVAIMRGPLVYCIEDCDNKVSVDDIAFVDGSEVKEAAPTTIAQVGNVIPIIARGRIAQHVESESLYRDTPWKYSKETIDLVYVPFFLRANRGGTGGMRVWTKRMD